MSDEKEVLRRRRRVKRLKAYLVVIFLVLLITPSVVSIVTLRNMQKLEKELEELTDRFNKFELTSMLKAEAQSALQAELEEKAESEEPSEEVSEPMHFEYYQDDYVVPDDFRKVYLTFDDGPSIYTTQILDVLDTYGVKATFFVTGKQAETHPEWYQEIIGRGHSIGMHSYTHIYSDIYESEDAFIDDIDKIHDVIEYVTGVDASLYRFPGGSSNGVSSVPMKDLCGIINDRGWHYFDWNVSSQDASSPSLRSTEIITNVVSGISKYDSSVVLMHDAADKYSTVQALPSIIESVLGMEKTVILPLDDNTEPVQHLSVIK